MSPITPSILPPALETITEKLQFSYGGPEKVGRFFTYEVDLADWNLSLTDTNPCIWVKASDLDELSLPNLADSLRDVVRIRGWQNQTVLVFADGKTGRLKHHLPTALPTFLLIDNRQQSKIQRANAPTVAMLDILLQQMERSQLAPYETHKPVTGSRFFGRQAEIRRVLQNPNTNYLFIGIRRMGKTSLLKEIQRRMDRIDPPKAGQIRRYYIDCTVINTEEDFLREITSALDPSEMKLLMGRSYQSTRYKRIMFDRFASIHGQPVTFLIDELDRLIKQIGIESELFDVLRAASIANKARFIMAGFRGALDVVTDMKTPFFNLATDVRLNRLRRKHVHKMVLGPMERLRVKIHNPQGVAGRIRRETAGLPNYVQYYCKTLLEQLDEKGQDTITENDLETIYDNRDFRDFVIDTFTSNTEPIERALVYALVTEDRDLTKQKSFSQRTMDYYLQDKRLPLKVEELDRACRNLEVAGVFNQVGRDYEFATPLLQRVLLQTRDINFHFAKTRDEILTSRR